jgi:hypothetical protein
VGAGVFRSAMEILLHARHFEALNPIRHAFMRNCDGRYTPLPLGFSRDVLSIVPRATHSRPLRVTPPSVRPEPVEGLPQS